MHIQCIICSDLISQNAVLDVMGLTCGHIFHGVCLKTWLDRSATCPHCRARAPASKRYKIYLTLASEPEGQDIVTLTRTVDNLKHELKMRTVECNNITQELNQHKAGEAKLQKQLEKFTTMLISVQNMELHLKEQKEYAANKSRQLTEAKFKVETLESELKQYQTIKCVINSARKEVDVGIDVDSLDSSQLIFLLGTFKKDIGRLSKMEENLKKALSKSESEKFGLTKKLNDMQESLELKNRIIESLKDSLAKETSLKKNLEEEVAGNCSKSEILKSPSEPALSFQNEIKQNKLQDEQNELPLVKKMVNLLPVPKPMFRVTSDRLRGISQINSLKYQLNSEGFNYDGMGGHSKEDVFPSGCRPKPGMAKAPKMLIKKKLKCPPLTP